MKTSDCAPMAVVDALALCCLAPILGPLLLAVSMPALIGEAGFVLVPSLLLVVCAVLYAWRRRRTRNDCGSGDRPTVGRETRIAE